MRALVAVVLTASVLAGCKRADPQAAAPTRLEGERCLHIADLSDVMHCEIAPYTSGTLGDEAAFRKALEQVRDLAPSDPAFYDKDRPWPAIAQTMLDSRDYKQGCADCHRRYQRIYKQGFQGSQIPWTDVHASK